MPQASAQIDQVVTPIAGRLVDPALPRSQRYIGLFVGVVTPTETYTKGFGQIRLGESQVPTERTFFEIGSITKTFVGIALVQSGYDIQTPLQKFYPEIENFPKTGYGPITLGNLITHTSALPSLPPGVDSLETFLQFSPAQLPAALTTLELGKSAAPEYAYSNFGIGLLTQVLMGKPPTDSTIRFEELIAKITGPLEMGETRVFLRSDEVTRLSEAYDHSVNPGAHWPWPKNSLVAGAGALKSTGDDMMKYLSANLGRHPSTIQNSINKSHSILFKANEHLSLAYGWHVVGKGANEIIWHNGGTSGFQTFLGFNKSSGTGVVILANTAHEGTDSPVDPRIDMAAMEILSGLMKAQAK